MTADAFERAYAERSGLTVAALRALGRVVRPCACGTPGCEGWQSLSQDAAADLDYWRAGFVGPVVVIRGEDAMPFSSEQIADLFTYHAPTGDDPARYEAIRAKARELAEVIVAQTPPCPDQTVAIRKLRECVHVANAAVALKGRY